MRNIFYRVWNRARNIIFSW